MYATLGGYVSLEDFQKIQEMFGEENVISVDVDSGKLVEIIFSNMSVLEIAQSVDFGKITRYDSLLELCDGENNEEN